MAPTAQHQREYYTTYRCLGKDQNLKYSFYQSHITFTLPFLKKKKKDKTINQELSGPHLTFHVYHIVDVEENEDAGATSLPTQPLQPSSSTYDPSNMPSSGYTGIQIPPGAHAPANTPAEVPHSTGRKLKLNRFEFFLS